MKFADIVWVNGKIAAQKSIALFPFFQGLNYGACIYEGIRVYETAEGAAVFRLDEHLDRFYYSASVLRMKLSYTKEELSTAILSLVKQSGINTGYIRPLAFYSDPKMGMDIFNSQITLVVLVGTRGDSPKTAIVRTKISQYERIQPKAIDFKAKIAGYYANNLLGLIEAKEAGFDEALFLDREGHLTEGSANNIFVVTGNKLLTPPETNILPGITRDTVMQIAPDRGFSIEEKLIAPEFLSNADEVFLTGTGIELEKVKEVEGFFNHTESAYPTSKILEQYYTEVVHGQVPKYREWLTLVR